MPIRWKAVTVSQEKINDKYRTLWNFIKRTYTYNCSKIKKQHEQQLQSSFVLLLKLPQSNSSPKVTASPCILNKGVVVPKELKIVFWRGDILLYVCKKAQISMYYIHRFTIYPWYENTMGGGDNKKGWETSYYSDCAVLPVLNFAIILAHCLNWNYLFFWFVSLYLWRILIFSHIHWE